MHLSSLIASNEGLVLHGKDIDVCGITVDSRDVKPGYLFIAIPGTKQDGRIFIDAAIKQGAAAVLVPENTQVPSGIPHITTADVRRAPAAIAAKFYPRQPQMIAAVTGTSGKTSTAQFAREIWQTLGHTSASIGTLGLVTAKESHYGSLTTPEATMLHKLLDQCAGDGITHLAMEASSHGLELHRLDHVHVKAGGFTNLSRDHLDYHETMEKYLAAKLLLFANVMEPGTTAVLNADDAAFDKVSASAKARGLKIMSYGKQGKDIRLLATKPVATGQHLTFELFGEKREVLLPVIGGFQAYNGLCALGLVIAGGDDEAKAVAALGSVTGVPGRLQLVGRSAKGGAVFVDYAHKPDALENVLNAMRPHAAEHGGKLGLIFGCGGNRDKGKRPLMGTIAQKHADWVIVTDDNPRHEEPATIRREILTAMTQGPAVQEIGDRAKAIARGIDMLGANDVLIIAGKGHESGQIIGDTTIPFDDAETARKVLK